jgi:hypothetical protein
MPEANGTSRSVSAVLREQRSWVWLGLLFAVLICLRGVSLLFDHSLNSIDGAMQTWFALDNFADGAKLGEAFQSYLGITMILALLPMFMAFGETLWASTFAAYVMVLAGSIVAAYAIVWMLRPVPRKQRWMFAILLLFIFYYAGSAVVSLTGLPYPATFDPGVSLRPLRGALAFLVLPVFVWALRRILEKETSVPALWFGLVAGVGLLWSNDAGIPLVVASGIGLTIALLQRLGLLLKALLAFALGVLASAFSMAMLVTHADPSGWLRYNFIDVAGDQFWYFGPWDRESRILGIADLPQIFLQGELLSTLSLIVLTACVIIATIRRARGQGTPIRTSAFVFVGASVFGTALIPQIGGHIGSEYNAMTFVLGMCAPLIMFQGNLFTLAKPMLRRPSPRVVPVTAGLAAITIIALETVGLVTTVQQTDRTVYSEELGFYVSPEMSEDLAAMKRLSEAMEERGFAEDRRILSVYTSALDIAAGTKSPAPVGSLIHALGESNRIAFNELLFNKTVAVTTIAPDYTGWSEWNTRANWPFFRHLRDLYRPVARNDQHVLWIRADFAGRPPEAQCEVAEWNFDSFEVVVRSSKAGLASLFFEREGFDASSRAAILTVTENSPFTRSVSALQWSDFPRYGVANSRMVEVSAPVEPGEETRLTFQVLDGSAIGWSQCYARVYDPIEFDALPSLSDGVDALIRQAEDGA